MADFVLLLVLAALGLAAGWWSASDVHFALLDRLDWRRSKAYLEALARHPFAQIPVMMALWLGVGWAALVSVVGPSQAAGTATLAPSSRDVEICHALQKTFVQDCELNFRMAGKPIGSVLPTPRAPCPQGGEFLMDEQGYIYCTRHGKNPSLPSLHDMNERGYRSVLGH